MCFFFRRQLGQCRLGSEKLAASFITVILYLFVPLTCIPYLASSRENFGSSSHLGIWLYAYTPPLAERTWKVRHVNHPSGQHQKVSRTPHILWRNGSYRHVSITDHVVLSHCSNRLSHRQLLQTSSSITSTHWCRQPYKGSINPLHTVSGASWDCPGLFMPASYASFARGDKCYCRMKKLGRRPLWNWMTRCRLSKRPGMFLTTHGSETHLPSFFLGPSVPIFLFHLMSMTNTTRVVDFTLDSIHKFMRLTGEQWLTILAAYKI